jgi:thioredoxin-like negative regulator of GroEL
MVLGLFGDSRPRTVPQLIADGDYKEAARRLRERVQNGASGPRVRIQLADVLVLAGRTSEGVALLLELADEHAKEGFFAKAIALLGRVEKLTPGRPGVSDKRRELMRRKVERDRARRAARPARNLEIGIEAARGPAPAVAAAPARPTRAVSKAPLGGDLLSIVEKALGE